MSSFLARFPNHLCYECWIHCCSGDLVVGGGPKGHPFGIRVCHYVFTVVLEAVVIFLGFGSVIIYSLLGWRLGSEKFVGWSATDGSANIQSVVAVNTKQTVKIGPISITLAILTGKLKTCCCVKTGPVLLARLSCPVV